MLTLEQLRRADRRIDTYRDPPRFSHPSELWLTQQAFDAWMQRLEPQHCPDWRTTDGRRL
jgi:hypothetical protein